MDSLAAALRSISDRLMKLAALADPQRVRDEAPNGLATPNSQRLLLLAQAVYIARRQRAAFIPATLLGEPAWDILLDLFIQSERSTKVSVTSACKASGAPDTTAQRWIGSLESSGLIERYSNADDKRVSFVRLTRPGIIAVAGWLRYRLALAS